MYAARLKPQLGLYAGRVNRTLPRRCYTQWKYQHPSPTRSMTWSWKAVGIAGAAGIGLHAWKDPVVNCEPPPSRPPQSLPPPPQSNIKVYELTFGTVCGICAGVFIKKGAKAIAFMLGGVFVLLQYLGSTSVVRVDWAKAASRFENLFYRIDEAGVRRPPSVISLWRWIVDFLTADFQQRATFVAGLALGLRIG